MLLARSRLPRRLGASWVRAGSTQLAQEKRVYVIAGEASGDAIGAKVIAALQRKQAEGDGHGRLVFRGIGGSQMTSQGGFESLFPMKELSVMGLVEVVPSVMRIHRRLRETLDDIRAFQPDVVLTIDSKGFTFRVQRALAHDPQLRNTVKRMHYVAPSVWAYKHRRRKTNFDDLKGLLHKMFVILPFEKSIFTAESSGDWCEFVGHPAVEDFLAFHGQFDRHEETKRIPDGEEGAQLEFSPGGLLENFPIDSRTLRLRGELFDELMWKGREDRERRVDFRVERGLPSNAFIVCALVGSRENEVSRTIRTVLEAVDALQRPAEQIVKTSFGIPMKLAPMSSGGCVVKRPIHVVFPTIQSLESTVRKQIDAFCSESGASPESFSVIVDADANRRIELFQAADAAVAVSGTIVMETAMAALPTVVIYRANQITELLAKQLSAVRFVSIPNLLLGREVIPELLFGDCTTDNISKGLREIYRQPSSTVVAQGRRPSQLAMALSTLTPWAGPSTNPSRGSELVAASIWDALTQPDIPRQW